MTNIQHLLDLLRSENHNQRYDACEQLRVWKQRLPQDAIDALTVATNDTNSDVADAARRALSLHTQVEEKSIRATTHDSSPKVNLVTAIGTGLIIGISIPMLLVILNSPPKSDIGPYLFIVMIEGIFGVVGSVLGYGTTKSKIGILVGSLIGALIPFICVWVQVSILYGG